VYYYGYVKNGNYTVVIQLQDENGDLYKDYRIEKNIQVSYNTISSIDINMNVIDTSANSIHYNYSTTTKYFDWKNIKATLSLIDPETGKSLNKTLLFLHSDINGFTNNSNTYQETSLKHSTNYKRQLKLTI
jgi:hypothetical protein